MTTWLSLTLIATFRPEDMPDRMNYLSFWNGFGSGRFEVGYMTLYDLVKYIYPNFYFFLFCSGALSIALKISAIYKMTPLTWGSLLLYISNLFILHDMIQMRCAIASGLLLHAVYYLSNRDKKRFLITSAIALLFHNSSLIIFSLWFLDSKRLNKYFYLGLIALSYAIGGVLPLFRIIQHIPIARIQYLLSMHEHSVGDNINIFNAVQLGRLAICIYLLLNIDRIALYNKYAVLMTKIFAISISVFVLFSSIPVVAFRVSELYQIVEIILIPMIVYSLKGHVILKRLSLIAIGLSFLLLNIFFTGILL